MSWERYVESDDEKVLLPEEYTSLRLDAIADLRNFAFNRVLSVSIKSFRLLTDAFPPKILPSEAKSSEFCSERMSSSDHSATTDWSTANVFRALFRLRFSPACFVETTPRVCFAGDQSPSLPGVRFSFTLLRLP